MNTFNIPEYKAWIESTKLSAVHRRSSKMKDLDKAIKDFGLKKGTAAKIKEKLKIWQDSKGVGAAWKQSSRNKRQAITKLDEALNGISRPGDQYNKDLAHTRLGVIYLLGNMHVNTNYVNLGLDGLSSLAGSILGSVGDNNTTDPRLIANQSDAVVSKVKSASYGLTFAKKPGMVITNAIESSAHTAKVNTNDSGYKRIVSWLKDFIRKLCLQLRSSVIKKKCRYGAEEFDWNLIISAAKNLIITAAKAIWKDVAPLIGQGVDLFKGLVNASDAVVKLVGNWWKGINVSVLNGHPSAITKSLKDAMKGSVKGGLYAIMKSSIAISIQVLLPAAGSLANTIISIVTNVFETIYNFVIRNKNIASMRALFAQAKAYWQEYEDKKSLPDASRPLFFHEKPAEFGQWYREAALYTPEIAALTLNSGICGDAMHFLNMFEKDGSAIDIDKFAKGVSYRNSLKNYSASFLRGSPFIFHSDKDQVSRYISLAKGFTTNSESKRWGQVKSFANA